MIDTKNLDAAIAEAHQAATLRDVGKIAAQFLQTEYPKGSPLVMSPITSGGVMRGGTPWATGNLRRLEKAITILHEAGIPVFNQLAFKSIIDKHRVRWRESDKSHANAYYEAILFDFYGPIIETDLVKVVFLLPQYKKSRSCKFVRRMVLNRHGLTFDVPIA